MGTARCRTTGSPSANPGVREALLDQIHAVSTGAHGGAQGFRNTQNEPDQKEIDWIGAMDGASFDTHSAYLLAAVAVERGEIPLGR